MYKVVEYSTCTTYRNNLLLTYQIKQNKLSLVENQKHINGNNKIDHDAFAVFRFKKQHKYEKRTAPGEPFFYFLADFLLKHT